MKSKYFLDYTCINPRLISNSSYCQLYNLSDWSSKNLVLSQLIIPLLTFFFILVICLLNIDIVRRNSVLVTHGSWRVKDLVTNWLQAGTISAQTDWFYMNILQFQGQERQRYGRYGRYCFNSRWRGESFSR